MAAESYSISKHLFLFDLIKQTIVKYFIFGFNIKPKQVCHIRRYFAGFLVFNAW